MKKVIVSVFFALAFSGVFVPHSASALIIQMDNGSYLSGYISRTYAIDEITILSSELDSFIATNPFSTLDEQDEYLRVFIANGELSKARGLSAPLQIKTSGVPRSYYNRMTSEEKKLARKYPAQLVKVYRVATKAEKYTKQVYGYNRRNDNSDAFRHCLWNALMKKSIGTSAAQKWATAHESDSSPHSLETRMDLFNNAVGRGIIVSGRTEAQIVLSAKDRVRRKQCRIIVRNRLVTSNSYGMKR